FDQATQDAVWLDKSIAALPPGPIPLARDKAIAEVRADPKLRGRVDRTARGRYTQGTYDLPSHEALALWERKHDIFGWGFLGGETLGMLLRPPRALAL